jgi:hypothetical protein
MPISRKKLKDLARKNLSHVGDNLPDMDREIEILSREIKIMLIAKEDAKWAGDTTTLHKLRYRLWLKNAMRNKLNIWRAKVMERMK